MKLLKMIEKETAVMRYVGGGRPTCRSCRGKMRSFCGTILAAVAVATCVVGAADLRNQIPPAKMPEAKHVFSMSCKVTACNGDLATIYLNTKGVSVNVPETGITLAPHELRICGDGIPRV